jgi:putative tricarboxylic transport membrane protein
MGDAPDAAERREGGGARGLASAAAMALAVMALGGFVVFDTATDLTGPGYAQVGPGVFPVIVGVALLLVGVALLIEAVWRRWRIAWMESDDLSTADSRPSGNPEISPAALGPRFRGDERTDGTPLRNVLLIAAALALNVMLFAPLGFIVASAVLFTCVSAAFGSRRFILDAAIGIAFAVTIYVVFVHGLGLSLPAGNLWEGVLWRR